MKLICHNCQRFVKSLVGNRCQWCVGKDPTPEEIREACVLIRSRRRLTGLRIDDDEAEKAWRREVAIDTELVQ